MRKYIYKLLFFAIFAWLLYNFFLRTNQQISKEKSPVKEEVIYGEDGLEYFVSEMGKRIPKAENGITVVNQTGWANEQMSFQQDYCEQSVASVADVIHPARFCSCFLSKVQFYYDPIYLREAYADQKAWNEACYQEALVE